MGAGLRRYTARMGPPLVIMGPTAVGKSALALRLARHYGGEIVNADALQVYRGFDLGTAKPGPAERAAVAHHLIDVLEPGERFSAGEFARRARAVLAAIEERGRLAVVVGGSGFYLRALLDGLSPIPPVAGAVRRRLAERLEREGLEALAHELAERDPVTAARLAPGDRQRIERALAVAISTGRPLSEWIARRPAAERPLAARRVGLTLPRAILYDRIAERVQSMVERGWVDEVAGLLERGVSPSQPAFQAIGYRQLARHLHGELSLDEALRQIEQATRRYAKRQLTWYRRQAAVTWFAAADLERCCGRIVAFLDGAEEATDGQA